MLDRVAGNGADFTAWRARFRDRRASPVDYIETLERQFAARELDVRAFVVADWDRARAAAREAEERYRRGQPLSPIDGLPVAVKDIIETADFPTQMQSPIFKGFCSRRNASVVERLLAGGAIVVGKTVTQEFACGISGPTRNPHDLNRTPGGSSSGTAAAVAAGMVPFGLGTQTRASTIRPSSYCGLFGLKPTFDLISLAGTHPVAPSLDTIGLLSASLDDLQSVFDWLVPRPPPSGKSKWRLLAIRTQGHEQIDEPVRALFCNATASFPRSIDVDGWDSPAAQAFDTAVQSADELIHDIMCCEMQWPYAGYARNPGGGLSDHIKQMVEKGARMSPSYAQQLQRLRNDLRATMREALTGYDGAVTLSASGVAPPGLDYSGSRSFPVPWSLMGGPSLSVPLLRHENLPIGIQLMMLPGQDHDVLDLAHLLA